MMHDHFAEHHGGAELPNPPASCFTSRSAIADAWWNRAIGAGANVVMDLADQFWGDRYGQLEDPFGHIWSIGAPSAPADRMIC